MQSVSSRIWTNIAMSIYCDDNHYTMGTSYTISRADICQCLPPDEAWHKVKSPKAD